MAKRTATKKSETSKSSAKPLHADQKKAAHFLASNGFTVGARSKHCLITRAAALIGYTRKAIHDWLKLEPFVTLIEQLQVEVDNAAHEGLLTCMRGIPEQGVLPNVAACIAWKKARHPEMFDEILRREEAKREHELKLFAMKCQHEKDMLELQRKGEADGTLAIPMFVYRETAPGERIVTKLPDNETEQ